MLSLEPLEPVSKDIQITVIPSLSFQDISSAYYKIIEEDLKHPVIHLSPPKVYLWQQDGPLPRLDTFPKEKDDFIHAATGIQEASPVESNTKPADSPSHCVDAPIFDDLYQCLL